MTKKLQHIFALSEKGARDLVKAVIWCFVCNLALMFPVGAVLFTVQHLLGCLEGGGSLMDGFWLYVGFALAVLILLFVLHWFQYASLYIATYRESANRRVSLAETLRRLPLSFFGNRDLSDLTATMIADCSSLDQMFSHYVPQLFASIGSTLVIGACMFACDWRMALAVLWVVPVAVMLTAGSKKIQDAFGTKNILNKRGGGRLHPGGAGNHPGHQGLPPAGAVSRRPGGKAVRHGGQLHPLRVGHRRVRLLRPGLPAPGTCHHGAHRRGAAAGRRALLPLFPGLPVRRRPAVRSPGGGAPEHRRHLQHQAANRTDALHPGAAGADGDRGLPPVQLRHHL